MKSFSVKLFHQPCTLSVCMIASRTHRYLHAWPVRQHLTWWSNVSRSERCAEQNAGAHQHQEGLRARVVLSVRFCDLEPLSRLRFTLGEGYVVKSVSTVCATTAQVNSLQRCAQPRVTLLRGMTGYQHSSLTSLRSLRYQLSLPVSRCGFIDDISSQTLSLMTLSTTSFTWDTPHILMAML